MDQKQDALFSVSGKVVAITGAAGVIYGAIARGLAARGAKLALLDLLGDKAQEAADGIRAEGGEAIGVACNVLDTDSIAPALDTIIKSFGRVDVLINGAGGNRPGASVPRDGVFTDLSLEEVDKVFALNYKGTFLPTQIFCKYFAKQGKGIIVNTSSMCSFAPLTNVPGYSNAKAAVTNFTQWLATRRLTFASTRSRRDSWTRRRTIGCSSRRTTRRSLPAATRSLRTRRWGDSATPKNCSGRSCSSSPMPGASSTGSR
jgi:NAD(P)-dependent dehydrogenase (short-subunit alcohol dehydrogenase family)